MTTCKHKPQTKTKQILSVQHHSEGAGEEGWNQFKVIARTLEGPEESRDGGQGPRLEKLSEVLERTKDSLENACGLAVERNVT